MATEKLPTWERTLIKGLRDGQMVARMILQLDALTQRVPSGPGEFSFAAFEDADGAHGVTVSLYFGNDGENEDYRCPSDRELSAWEQIAKGLVELNT